MEELFPHRKVTLSGTLLLWFQTKELNNKQKTETTGETAEAIITLKQVNLHFFFRQHMRLKQDTLEYK